MIYYKICWMKINISYFFQVFGHELVTNNQLRQLLTPGKTVIQEIKCDESCNMTELEKKKGIVIHLYT